MIESGIAIVTGAAGGIGASIAERLVADGLRVVSLDIVKPERQRESIIDLVCDLSDASEVTAAVAYVEAQFGPALIVVHCAAFQMIAPFDRLTAEDWDKTFRVNVDGAFHLVRAVLPGMQTAGWGRIVMITSSSQFTPPQHMTHYVSSKGALTGMVRSLATEVGPYGVTVNAVAPGLIATDHALSDVPPAHFDAVLARQAIKRTGHPDDIAAAVSFVVSGGAGFMTGQTLLIDGGEGRI